jgi:hypothetical protein
MGRIIGEVIEIKLDPYINRENEFSLSRPWKPLIHTMKEQKKMFSKNKTSF